MLCNPCNAETALVLKFWLLLSLETTARKRKKKEEGKKGHQVFLTRPSTRGRSGVFIISWKRLAPVIPVSYVSGTLQTTNANSMKTSVGSG